MHYLIAYLEAVWWLTVEMAPWLLMGFAIAGLCGQLISQDFVERHLSRRSLGTILKAVVIGIPLPVCSCGVIPVAATLRKKGASKGAVAAFTASTPQNGIDSIAVTYSLMGWIFMLGRLTANVLSGLLAGILVNLTDRKAVARQNEVTSCCCQKKQAPSPCCAKSDEPADSCCNHRTFNSARWKTLLVNTFREAFIQMPSEIGKYLVIGILLGALLGAFIPDGYMAAYLGHPIIAYAAVTLVAIPIYVCDTGSIPIAFGLIQAGVSPGAAIVFLIAGPATNTATVATLTKMIGKWETLIYLLTLIGTSWAVGYVFDYAIPREALQLTEHHSTHNGMGTFGIIAGIAFVLMLLNTLRPRKHA